MDLSGANIRRRMAEFGGFLKIHWLAGMILLLIILLAVVNLQRYFDRRAVENQAEKLRQYDADRQKSAEQTQVLQNIFDQQHQSTLNILDALTAMSGTLTKLTENDLRQDKAVQNLKEEYQDAKNAKPENKTTSIMRARRRALPVREREDRALSTDSELYPAADNHSASAGN